MIQDIELYTADGRLVETVQDPIVGMMGANGKPPEVVVWGERVFVLAPPDAYRPGTIRYREGMAWALRLGQEATAMPSPRVHGALAGLTLLPVSTGAAIPRPETPEDDIPDPQKMTESYKPPEDENPGQHLARLGTDGWIWTQDFMYRFPGAVDEDSEGVGKRPDAGTMLGWFANAIETGRAAGYGQGRAADIDEFTSDGYHTFRELYDHRRALTVALARSIPGLSWRSKRHHPDSDPIFDGYFIVGLSLPSGQVTYHYKLEHWDDFEGVRVLDHAPPYDGHTPAMTIERLMSWASEKQ